DHRRRERAEGRPAGPARAAGGDGGRVRGRDRGVVRLDAGLDVADRTGRARPLPGPVRGVPDRARGARDPPALEGSEAMSSDADAYSASGVDDPASDRTVDAIVGVLRGIDPGRPSRVVDLPGHYASVLRVTDELGIAVGTDGVGSKIVVAEETGRLDT